MPSSIPPRLFKSVILERSSASVAQWKTSSASAKLPSSTNEEFDFTASVAASSKNSAFTRKGRFKK
jgi:hypothetical protein